MRVIYIDVLFLINLIINYLLLLSTMLFCGVYTKRYRLFLSALAGAFYCVLIFIPELSFLMSAAGKLISGALLILIAFYKKKLYVLLKLYLMFIGLSAALAGGIIALYWLAGSGDALVSTKNGVIYADISLKVLLIGTGVGVLLINLFFRRTGANQVLEKEIKPVEIAIFGKKTTFYTLVDTGNELHDPITGKRVLVAQYDSIRPCLPERLRQSFEFDRNFNAAEIFERASRMGYAGILRLLPYKTIAGKESSMMVVLKPDQVLINHKPARDIVLGLSFEGLKGAKGYSALVGV